jgi:molybdopterin synthase sulfur carrier subunit
MADVHLPSTLRPLFPGLPRQLDVQANTVGELIDHLEREWPGLRDRLCEPGPTLRHHIHVYVNQERAKLDTPVARQSRVDVIAAISGGSDLPHNSGLWS